MVLNLDQISKKLERLLNLVLNDPDLYSPSLTQFFNNHCLLSLTSRVYEHLRKNHEEAKEDEISLKCKVLTCKFEIID